MKTLSERWVLVLLVALFLWSMLMRLILTLTTSEKTQTVGSSKAFTTQPMEKPGASLSLSARSASKQFKGDTDFPTPTSHSSTIKAEYGTEFPSNKKSLGESSSISQL